MCNRKLQSAAEEMFNSFRLLGKIRLGGVQQNPGRLSASMISSFLLKHRMSKEPVCPTLSN